MLQGTYGQCLDMCSYLFFTLSKKLVICLVNIGGVDFLLHNENILHGKYFQGLGEIHVRTVSIKGK